MIPVGLGEADVREIRIWGPGLRSGKEAPAIAGDYSD